MFFRLKKYFSLIFILSMLANCDAAIICDQLASLSPNSIRFIVHPQGDFVASQEVVSADKTQLSFYQYQTSNSEGRPEKLFPLCSLPDESAQGITWAWANNQPFFAYSTPAGKLAIYKISKDEETEISTAELIGEKLKPQQAEHIAWNSNGEFFAIICDNKIKVYALDLESRKHPIRRVSIKEITLKNILAISWSHDDSFLAAASPENILFWRTKTPAGNIKLTPYSNKRIDQAINQGSTGAIKDISWNHSGIPTLAVLSKKILLISLPDQEDKTPLVQQNISSNSAAALAWNKNSNSEHSQEIIVSTQDGRNYRVYTVTGKSFLYNSTMHSFLPPTTEVSRSPLSRYDISKELTHIVADETMIELVNKLTQKPASLF